MKISTKGKKKTNVLNISDNKRFVEVAVPQATEEIEMNVSRFGFPAGSTLICRTDFDYSEIRSSTIVVLHAPGEFYQIGAGRHPEKNIHAVVDCVKLDLRVK